MRQHRDGVAIDVRVAETLHVDVPGPSGVLQRIAITVEDKSGRVARLRIQADETVAIRRPRREPSTTT